MSVIEDIDQFIQKVRCCRELKIPRHGNLYTHHVFVGKKDKRGCDLYHYTSVSSCLGSPGQITKVHLDYEEYRSDTYSPIREIFDLKKRNGDKIYIVKRRDYPKNKQSENECIQRAEKRLGEQSYSACCNNCESYVNWIFSGDNTSEQAENDIGKNVLGNIVDGAFSRGAQHQMAQIPITVPVVLGIIGGKCISVIGNRLEKMIDLIPTQTVSLNTLKSMTHSPNKIKTLLNSNFMKLNVHIDPKMREELGKRIISWDTFDFTKQGPTQHFLLEQIPSLVKKQDAKSLVRQLKIDGVQQLQASSKSAAAGAFKLNIIAETVSLLVKMYQIKTDAHLTNDQKTRSYKRELGSYVGGVLGTLIGETCIPIPIIGGYLGGVIGNTIGGAIGGAL